MTHSLIISLLVADLFCSPYLLTFLPCTIANGESSIIQDITTKCPSFHINYQAHISLFMSSSVLNTLIHLHLYPSPAAFGASTFFLTLNSILSFCIYPLCSDKYAIYCSFSLAHLSTLVTDSLFAQFQRN